MMTTVGFLGMGAMGSRIAGHILESGHRLRIWNRTASRCEALAARGAIVCNSPALAATGADIVISMVTDDDASKQVWMAPDFGALDAMAPGGIAVESSTLSIGWCKQLSEQAKAQGIDFLEAPVAGSRPQAEAGQLHYLIGGDAQVLEKVHALLTLSAAGIHHIGAHGQGMAMKLAVNALLATQAVALAEVLMLLANEGIARDRSVEVLGAMPVTSAASKAMMAGLLAEAYAPLFPIALVAKDLGYVLNGMPNARVGQVCAATATVYEHALAKGWGNENIHAVAKALLD